MHASCFRTFAFLLLGLGLLLAGCSRKEVADHPRMAPGVVMRDVSFYSAALGRTMTYRVYLPAVREAGQRWPVVYLLHGNGGGFRDWSNDSDVVKYAAQGLILVMPEGESSYYLNAVEKPADQFEDYLTHDLVTDVEGRFAAQPGRAGRALVGVSMGGYGALKLGFSHPEMYTFVGALSPPVDVPQRKFTFKRASQWWEFRRIFGPMNSDDRKARDVFALAQTADPAAIPYIYLAAGAQEPLLDPIRRFEARLKTRGLAHEFHTLPGGHDWGEWDAQIPGCFAELLRRMAKSQSNSK